MSGGGKGGKSKGPSLDEQLAAQQKAIEMARPDPVQLQTTGWGGMGPNIPQNAMGMGTAVTGQGVAPPSWAQGDWAMPWWGQQAPNVGAAMMQQGQPQQGQPQAPQAPGGGQPQQMNPRLQELLAMRQNRRPMFGKGPMTADNEGRLGWSLDSFGRQNDMSGMQPYYGPAYQGPQGGQGQMDIRQLLAMRGMR